MKRVTSRQRLAYWAAFDADICDEDSDYETCYEPSLSRPSSFVSLPLALDRFASDENFCPPVTVEYEPPCTPGRKRSRGDDVHPASLIKKNVSFSSLVKAVESPQLVPAYDFEFTGVSDDQDGFQDVADDVQLHVLSFLTASEARAVSATSRHFRHLIISEEAVNLWTEWCHRQWPMLQALNTEGRMVFKDDFFLPTALGNLSNKLRANLSVLLGMAADTQPTAIDETLFMSARTSLRMTPRFNVLLGEPQPQGKRPQFRTFCQDNIPVLQFTGAVGTGDRCVRSDQPLASPKLIVRPTRKWTFPPSPSRAFEGGNTAHNSKHSLFDMICGSPKPSSLWRPFVAPYVSASTTTGQPHQVHLTPRFVSYFEISILQRDESKEPPLVVLDSTAASTADCVAIGVSSGVFHLHSKMPGWDKLSYGYHGDDGGIFHASGDMVRRFGPRYGPGDTVGCGVDYVCGGIFFTLNGEFLGYGWTNINQSFLENHELYPTIGVDTNCPIACNFGERQFAFDLTPLVRSHGTIVENCLLPLTSPAAECCDGDVHFRSPSVVDAYRYEYSF